MSYDFRDVTVLVAEDIKMMQELITFALGCLGVRNVIKASDGYSAYKLFQENNPDIVICDWQMSPIDGLSLVKKIRKDRTSVTRTVPIVMITGYASERYVREARDAGVNEFLVKPFTAEALAARLAVIIEKPRRYVDSQHYFGPDRRRKLRNATYLGPFRRDSDQVEDSSWSVEL